MPREQELIDLFRQYYVRRADNTSANEVDIDEQFYNWFTTALADNQHVYGTLTVDGASTLTGATTSTGDLSTAGNLTLTAAGKGLSLKTGGAAAKFGTAVLDGASPSVVTVNTTAVGATSVIFLSNTVTGGTPGILRVDSRVNGTSFTIKSGNSDTSTVAWMIITPAP